MPACYACIRLIWADHNARASFLPKTNAAQEKKVENPTQKHRKSQIFVGDCFCITDEIVIYRHKKVHLQMSMRLLIWCMECSFNNKFVSHAYRVQKLSTCIIRMPIYHTNQFISPLLNVSLAFNQLILFLNNYLLPEQLAQVCSWMSSAHIWKFGTKTASESFLKWEGTKC